VTRTGNRSVAEAKDEISATEFIRWVAFFEREWNEQDRLIYQLAQNSYQTYLLMFIFGGTPTKTIEDFVLEFKTGVEQFKKQGKALESESQQAKGQWLNWMNAQEKVEEKNQKKTKTRKVYTTKDFKRLSRKNK
jgi:hypothetical protein